ncbi:MAG: hypothetical protein V2B18_12950 [Pseudomonadota bacterium]
MHQRSWLLLTMLLLSAFLAGNMAAPALISAQSAPQSTSTAQSAAETQYPPWTPQYYQQMFYAVSGVHSIVEKDSKKVVLFTSPRNLKIDTAGKKVEVWDSKGKSAALDTLKVGDGVTAAWRDDHVVFLIPPERNRKDLPPH